MRRKMISRSTAHLDGLSKQARDAIRELNASTTIGPHAKGDGDLLQWHLKMVLILGQEFETARPSLRVSGEQLGKWRTPIADPGDSLTDHFLMNCRHYGIWLMDQIYPELTVKDREIWGRIYDEILVPELHLHWGGRFVRLAMRRKPLFDPVERVAEGLRMGLHPLESFRRAGVSRATGYRILNRKA